MLRSVVVWLVDWLAWRGFCRLRPCVGVGGEVLSLRRSGPGNLQLLGNAPKGRPRVGAFPCPTWLSRCCWCVAIQASTLLLSSLSVSAITGEAGQQQCVGSNWCCLTKSVGLRYNFNVCSVLRQKSYWMCFVGRDGNWCQGRPKQVRK